MNDFPPLFTKGLIILSFFESSFINYKYMKVQKKLKNKSNNLVI